MSFLTAIRDYAGARESLNAAANTIIGDRDLERIKRLGMSPRQQRLNFLWSFYAACQYDGRKVAWDGGEYMDPAAREAVASQGVIPPGFYDAADSMPLRFRRPLAPYHLARVITSRFTGLLFSERRHPRVTCPGDPVKEDYAQGLIEASRLWQRMNIARNFGGATGSVGLGFQFVKGKPLIEVWDPRWCFPKFKSRATMELEALEIRWIYPVEERDERGRWIEVPHWYRRYIDENQDTEWSAVPVGDGEEPDWEVAKHTTKTHGFKSFPGVWVQNSEVPDDVDGDGDYEAVIDMIEQMDRLLSRAIDAVDLNADPTVVLSNLEDTADQIQEVKKGSHNALKLPKGTASYLEISGTGSKSALEAAQLLRDWVLEVAQCVIEDPAKGSAATATEIERNYASMHERADVLREQWGSRAILPLVEKMIEAAQSLEGGRLDDKGIRSIGKVQVPPKLTPGPDGKMQVQPRAIPAPDGPPLQIVWPPYFQPTLDDANKAVTTAMQATGGQSALMDLDTAVKFIAPYVASIDNAQQLVDKLKQEADAKKAEMDAQMMQGIGGFGGPPPQGPPEEGQPPAAPDDGAPPEMPPEPPPAT